MKRRNLLLAIKASVGLLAALGMFVFLPLLLRPSLTDADLQGIAGAESRLQFRLAQAKLQNDVRTTMLQAVAGFLVVAGALATWRQVQVSRDGQITDRFTRAIEQIGSDNVDVRLGGIYALERLAKNSPDDRAAIQYILGVFITGHAEWPVGRPDGPEHPTRALDEHLTWLHVRAPDVQAASVILGRWPDPSAAARLYLSRVDLRGVYLPASVLTDTILRHSTLVGGWLRGIKLDRSDLTNADLQRTNLAEASLVSATLAGAYLEGADLRGADLRGANLQGADMRASNLRGARLTGAKSDARTVWPSGFDLDQRRNHGIVEIESDNPDR